MTGLMITNYLDEIISNPVCELIYNKDYELLISVMLSAQTTDKRVNMVTEVLYKKYPSLKLLSEANIDDIKKIIRPLGTYNKKAKNVVEISKRLLADTNGKVIKNREYLESLPGVGRKTVNVVFAELFKEDVIAVDTHVARVSKRLNIARKNDDVLKIEQKIVKKFKNASLNKLHLQLVLFGRYYCKAVNPKCGECKLKNICKYYNKHQER